MNDVFCNTKTLQTLKEEALKKIILDFFKEQEPTSVFFDAKYNTPEERPFIFKHATVYLKPKYGFEEYATALKLSARDIENILTNHFKRQASVSFTFEWALNVLDEAIVTLGPENTFESTEVLSSNDIEKYRTQLTLTTAEIENILTDYFKRQASIDYTYDYSTNVVKGAKVTLEPEKSV